LIRRIGVGVLMGAVVITSIFSGTTWFAVALGMLAIFGQQEYYQMVHAKGHLPATKLGRLTSAAMFLMSGGWPRCADAVFAIGGALICSYLLFRRSPAQASIADVSTTFMGLYYCGYMPEFWVRLHGCTFNAPWASGGNRWSAFVANRWPEFVPRPCVKVGAVVVFWSWLANATADIGAFAIGKLFGRTRLIAISPKKTVEGAVAGLVCACLVSIVGAWFMHWPMWQLTGFFYGAMVGVFGLLGDLTESLFKRDAGIKDSGTLFPGHGGILDRTDSYVFIAPLAYYFVAHILPFIHEI